MKLAVFLFIIFIGTVGKAGGCCIDDLSTQQKHSAISSSQVEHRVLNEGFDQNGKKDSGCQQSSSTCPNCHLGHCAFTLDSSIDFASFILPQGLIFTKIFGFIFDFHTSPFRPPIA